MNCFTTAARLLGVFIEETAGLAALRAYGIVFLSGGQSPEDATNHLNAMNAMGSHPWQLSFSYGRALQEPVLATWKGQESNTAAAQQAFFNRCRLNGLAREGAYSRVMEAAI